MDSLFQVHKLNEEGLKKAAEIAEAFNTCLDSITALVGSNSTGREMAVVRTKLEEACFFTKKAMANEPENQQ